LERILIATDRGLHVVAGGQEPTVELPGHRVTALATSEGALWAITDGEGIWRSDGRGSWEQAGTVPGRRANCMAPGAGGLLIGTSEAHLARLSAEGIVPVAAFEEVEGRDEWYTPWGGPPDARSISRSPEAVFVNVHVGGIPRSLDEGSTWSPTIDIHADVHQVLAHGDWVFARRARELAASPGSCRSWEYRTEGLHSGYCRAVAVSGDTVLLSASAGPRGGRAALYRGRLDGRGVLERCRDGLPEWFDGNIDTQWVAGSRSTAAFATPGGEAFVSGDGGATWERVASGLPAVHAVLLA